MEPKRPKQDNLPSTCPAPPPMPPFAWRGPVPEQKSQGFSLRDMLTILFKHRQKIIATLLLTMIAAPIIYFCLPVIYEATSLLMIRSGREYVTPNVGNEPTPLRVAMSDVVNTESSILCSRDLAERVIDTIGLKDLYPKLGNIPQKVNPLDVAIEYFAKDLVVDAGKNSNIIKVSFQHKSPEMAAKVVNQLVDSYKDKRLEILSDRMSTLMLQKKVAEYSKKLNDAADDLESLKQKHQVSAFDDQRNLLMQQRMEMETQTKSAQTQEKELRQRLSSLESQLKAVPENVLSGQTDRTSEAELQLLTLQRKEQELLSKYKEDTVMVGSVRNEIRLVQDFIQNQATRNGGKGTVFNDFYRDIQKEILTTKADLSATTVKAAELSSQLGELDRKIQDLDSQERTFRDLRRELLTAEEKYLTYTKKLEEAHISDDMDRQNMTSVNVIERATVQPLPISPKRGLLFFVAVGVFAGLGGGVAIAFFIENMGQGIASPERAEKCLGLPVLTTVNYRDRNP